MDYKDYKVEDFLLDDNFIAWVKTNENDALWQLFLVENAQHKPIIEQAKNMILAARMHVTIAQKERLKTNIFQQIDLLENDKSKRLRILRRLNWTLLAVASVTLLIVSGMFFDKKTDNTEGVVSIYNNLIKNTDESIFEVSNEKDKPKLVILPDKSSILLQKGSRLSYPKSFDNVSERVVYLSGEAFFEVSKNPNQPFLVYANELVTKVLGTSFNIKAFSHDKNVVVTVKTGKVSVFSKMEMNSDKTLSTENTEGVILTPNQQVTFDRKDANMSKVIVQTPALQELTDIQKLSFEFNDTPVSKVFELLEKAYGIDILYDQESLKHCKLTASLSDEHLFDKLNLIGLALEVTYDIKDSQIIIHSKGCK